MCAVGVDISVVVVFTLHSEYIGNFIHPNEMHHYVIPLFKQTKKRVREVVFVHMGRTLVRAVLVGY